MCEYTVSIIHMESWFNIIKWMFKNSMDSLKPVFADTGSINLWVLNKSLIPSNIWQPIKMTFHPFLSIILYIFSSFFFQRSSPHSKTKVNQKDEFLACLKENI